MLSLGSIFGRVLVHFGTQLGGPGGGKRIKFLAFCIVNNGLWSTSLFSTFFNMRSMLEHHFEEDFGASKNHLDMLKLILEALLAPHRNSAWGLLGPKSDFRRAVFRHPYRGFAFSSEKDAFQRISKIQRISHDGQNAQKRPKTNLSETQKPILAQHSSQKRRPKSIKINENFDEF